MVASSPSSQHPKTNRCRVYYLHGRGTAVQNMHSIRCNVNIKLYASHLCCCCIHQFVKACPTIFFWQYLSHGIVLVLPNCITHYYTASWRDATRVFSINKNCFLVISHFDTPKLVHWTCCTQQTPTMPDHDSCGCAFVSNPNLLSNIQICHYVVYMYLFNTGYVHVTFAFVRLNLKQI